MHSVRAMNGVSPAVAQAAAEWFLLLRSDAATADDHAQFKRWRGAADAHERAWVRLEAMNAKLELIPPALGVPMLRRGSQPDRRAMLRGLACLAVAPAALWIVERQLPWRAWSADLRTAVGERRELVLDDGGLLHLNTDSAVDVRYDASQRLLRLQRGEILAQTATDPAGRPFIVETTQGRVRALGTRFMVRVHADFSEVTVLEHAVEVQAMNATTAQRVEAGQRLRFDAKTVGAPLVATPHSDGWSQGLLQAEDMRLGDFIAELSRYRPGVLRCDPAVADLKVSGAFQLERIEPVLRSLPRVLPVRIVSTTGWWMTVVPAL